MIEAILRTVAYADVFDCPLSAQEVHRYLVDVRASPSEVQDALHDEQLVPQRLSHCQGFYTLRGREAIVERHLRRAALAAQMWPKARRYGRAIASLPFVRMVAITGSLAMNSVDPGADIDYLILTVPQRLWLARSLCIALVYLGRLERIRICPNYVMSVDALEQFDRSLFTAHELAQMRPLYGLDTYRQLVGTNDWACAFLPNAFDLQKIEARMCIPLLPDRVKGWIERALAGKLGDLWEKGESRVKIQRLRQQVQGQEECAALFTAQRCKGHVENHGRWIAQAYTERLKLLGLDAAHPRGEKADV